MKKTKKWIVFFLLLFCLGKSIFFRNNTTNLESNQTTVLLFSNPDDLETAIELNGMVKALGYDENGNEIHGWVYARELESKEPSNPTEAILKQKVNDILESFDDGTINLYDSDGVTITGNFDKY